MNFPPFNMLLNDAHSECTCLSDHIVVGNSTFYANFRELEEMAPSFTSAEEDCLCGSESTDSLTDEEYSSTTDNELNDEFEKFRILADLFEKPKKSSPKGKRRAFARQKHDHSLSNRSSDSGFFDFEPSKGSQEKTTTLQGLKKLIRKGDWPVTHEIRKHLWILLCSDKNYDSLKGVFERKMVEENSIIGRSRKPMFIKEEGTVINNFDLNEEGAVRLLRLLSIVENDHPTMTSAPVLYPLCALLLHYMSDADSYACVEFLLRKRHYVHREARRRDAEDEIAHPRERAADPRSHCSFLNYVCKSNREWFASAHTILALVKKHKPNAYALLKRRCGTNDEDVLAETMRDWLRWIFAGLPMAHAVRVIDCFLVEGQKFIIRAGIAIVYIWSKAYKGRRLDELMGKSGAERISDVKEELWQTAKTLEISTDTFIEVCVSIRNLKGVTIARLQQEFEKKVAGEVERRESQKRARAPLPLYTDVFQSVIVDPEVAVYIMQALPARLQLSTPELLFRLSRDGASFTQLWTKVDEAEQSLIIIRSTSGEIFGAYCSACWAERNDRKERTKSKYFGTGESFVWKIDQSDEAQLPIIYRWVGAAMDHPDSCPQMFMAANDKLLLIGSGGGDAIRISEELSHGMSSNCSTFESPPLVKDNSFYIHELEVFGVTA